MSSDSSPGRFPKKYLGSVNKNINTSSQRSNNAKFLTTGSKVSAPKPLNLPSLRHESSKASPDSTCSTSGESDHHPTSITSTPTMINRWGSPLHQQQQQHTISSNSDSDSKSKVSTTSSSPVTHQRSPSASPAWSAISSTTKKVTDTAATSTTITSAITTIPSPPCDSTPKNTVLSPKKDHVKITVSHHAKPADIPMPFTQASEPSNMSWDEMVSEEMDFNVSVVDDNDDDDTKVEDQESTTTSLEDGDGNTSLNENQSSQQQPVSPSDRFTDDYDRSYPSTAKRTSPGSLYNSQPHETYRHQDRYHHHHHYHDPYHNNNNNNVATQGGGKWSSERRGSEHSNTSGYRGQRRPSSSSHSATGAGWNIHNDQQRRVSQDRPKPPQSPQQQQLHPDTSPATTTLLRRPSTTSNNGSNNNINGLYSTSDDRPPEIVAAQRQAMLSAAEQAKKRREADEAERQAAAARARQKALALAPPTLPPPSPKQFETTPPLSPDNHISSPTPTTPVAITILTHAHEDQHKATNKTPPTDSTDNDTTYTENKLETTVPVVKEGTLITSTTASTGTNHLFANKPKAPLTQDEISWEDYVNQIKKTPTATNIATTTSDKNDGEKATSVSDWSSFAHRLQRSTEEKKARVTKDSPKKTVSLTDQQQQSEPEPVQEKMDKASPTSSSGLQQNDTSEPETTGTTQPPAPPLIAEEETTSSVASGPIKPRRFIKPNTKLDNAVYPIFPDAIGRFVVPKPTSLQFMMNPDESDDELMHTLEHHYHHQVDFSPAKPTLEMPPPPPPPPPMTESETATDRVEPSSSLSLSSSSPAPPSLDDQTTITETKKQPTPIPTTHDDTLYPKGLPVPGSLVMASPASITPASIHTTLSNLDLPPGYSKDALPVPHNDHYPLLMYPLHAPPSDLLKTGSHPRNQTGFSVVLLPPGNVHSPLTAPSKPVSSHRHGPRRGYGRYRGAGGRGKHHHHPSSSSTTGSWRPSASTTTDASTKGGRSTANTA